MRRLGLVLGLHGLILISKAAAWLFVSGAMQSLGWAWLLGLDRPCIALSWAWLLGLVTGHAQPIIRLGMTVRTSNRPCTAYNQAGHGC